jgi:hypothetical protein
MKNNRKHNHTKLFKITKHEAMMIEDEWKRRYNAEVSKWVSNMY